VVVGELPTPQVLRLYIALVPKPSIETGVEAITLAVLSVFDQHAGGK